MEHQDVAAGEKKETACRCPFCDNALAMPYPYCQVCGSRLRYCPVCGQPLPKGADTCPHCAEQH